MEIKNIKKIEPARWSGGSTYQMLISPKDATIKEGFSIRISSATIEAGESNFSDFSGYNRFLTILSGKIDIKHEDGEWKELNMHEPHYFDGGVKTQSRSSREVMDFNVIWNKNISDVKVEIANFKEYSKISNLKNPIFILSLDENASLKCDNTEYTLNRWDYINLKNETDIKVKGNCIIVSSPLL